MLTEIFNGQSYALTMHQMDFYESRGRLNDEAKEIMIASHYRPLTTSEILKLQNLKIVLNSQKQLQQVEQNISKCLKALSYAILLVD